MIRVDKDTNLDELLTALRTIDVIASTGGNEGGTETKKPATAEELIDRLEKVLPKVEKKRKKAKPHWTAVRRARRDKFRRRMAVIRTKRNAAWAAMLKDDTPESWLKWFSRKSNTSWQTKPGWKIGLEDYTTYIHPKLVRYGERRIPVVMRYNTRREWSLQNTVWYDSETREVLVDGAEAYMLKRRYILDPDTPSPRERWELDPTVNPEDILG